MQTTYLIYKVANMVVAQWLRRPDDSMQVCVHQICNDVNVLEAIVVRREDDVFDDDEVLMPPKMPQQFELPKQTV